MNNVYTLLLAPRPAGEARTTSHPRRICYDECLGFSNTTVLRSNIGEGKRSCHEASAIDPGIYSCDDASNGALLLPESFGLFGAFSPNPDRRSLGNRNSPASAPALPRRSTRRFPSGPLIRLWWISHSGPWVFSAR